MAIETAVLVRCSLRTLATGLTVAVLAIGFLVTPSCPAADDAEVQALVNVLKDPTKDTSKKGDACLKLMDMGPRAKPAVPALIELLKAKDQDMRDYAITTLKRIGPGASTALPALKKVAAEDPSDDIRQLADDAVKTIGGARPQEDVVVDDKPVKVEKPAPPDRGAGQPIFRPVAPAGPIAALGRRPAYDMSLMTTMFPELAKAPPPDWVKPGVQFTYYCAAATISGDGPVFQLDPQGDLWATDGSGKRYSMKPGGRINNDLLDAGHSGHGFAQYTIVSVNPDSVAVAVDVYTISGGISAARLGNRAAFVGAPSSTADLWVSPQWLAQVKPESDKMMYRIFRISYTDEGKTRQAVVFAGNDGSMAFIYDLTTGALLYRGGSGEGEKGENLMIDGVIIPNTPTRMLTLSQLLSRRSLNLPWTGQNSPDWVDQVRALHYAGDCGVVMQGSPNIRLPLRADLEVRSRGPGWARFHLTQAAGGAGGALPVMTSFDWVAGPGQLGSLWVSPDALARLQPGQELDRDANTQFVTTYEGPQREPNGAEVLMITRANKGQTLKYGYDGKTGILLYSEQADHGLAGSMVSRASLRGRE